MLNFNDVRIREVNKSRALIEEFRKEYESFDEVYRPLRNNELVIKIINIINALKAEFGRRPSALREAIFLLVEIEKNLVNTIYNDNVCFENDILRKVFNTFFIRMPNYDEIGIRIEHDIDGLNRLDILNHQIENSYLIRDLKLHLNQMIYRMGWDFGVKFIFPLINDIYIELNSHNSNSRILEALSESLDFNMRDRILELTEAVIESISNEVNFDLDLFANLPVSEWSKVFRHIPGRNLEINILEAENIKDFKKVIFVKFVKTFLSAAIRSEELLEDISRAIVDCFDESICSSRFILSKLIDEGTHNNLYEFDLSNDNINDFFDQDFIHKTINNDLNIKGITYIFELPVYKFIDATSHNISVGSNLTSFLILGEYLIQNQDKLGKEKFEEYLEKLFSALEVNRVILIDVKCNAIVQLLNRLCFASIQSSDSLNRNSAKLLNRILTITVEERSNRNKLDEHELNHIINEPAIGIHFRANIKQGIVQKLESLYSESFEYDKEQDELILGIKSYINNDLKSMLIRDFGDKSTIPCDIEPKLSFSNVVLNKVGVDMVEEYINVVLASFDNYIRLNLLKKKILSAWLAASDLDKIVENERDQTSDKKLISERLKTEFCMAFFNAAFAYNSIGDAERFAFSCPEGLIDRLLDVLDGRHTDVEILHKTKVIATKEQVLDELQRGIKVKIITNILDNKNDSTLIACHKILADSAKKDYFSDITFDKVLSDNILLTGVVADTFNQLNLMDSTCLSLSGAYMELVNQSEYLSFKDAYIAGLLKSLKCGSLEQFYEQICDIDKSCSEMNDFILTLQLKKKSMQLDLYSYNRSSMLLSCKKHLSKEISELKVLISETKEGMDKLNVSISKILVNSILRGLRSLIKTQDLKNHVADALLSRDESNITLMVNEIMSLELFDNLIIKNIELNIAKFINSGFKIDSSKIDPTIIDYIIDSDRFKDANLTKVAAKFMKDIGIIKSIDNYTVDYILDNINVVGSGELVKFLKNTKENLSKNLAKVKL